MIDFPANLYTVPQLILTLQNLDPFIIPEAWIRYTVRVEPPHMGHYREYPCRANYSTPKRVERTFA